jgi:hypothetical protein
VPTLNVPATSALSASPDMASTDVVSLIMLSSGECRR